MKKILIPFAMMALLTSCEEILGEKEPSSCSIKASAVQECIMTKVNVDLVNGKMTWRPGDTLAVCTGSSFKAFTPDSTGISVTDFHGNAPESSIRDCAIYPWSCSPAIAPGKLRISLPGRMSYTDKVVDAPMYAPADEWQTYGIFYFKQMGGILHIKMPVALPSRTSHVTIQAPGKKICGDFDVVRDSGTPFYETCESKSDTLLRIDAGISAWTRNICCPMPVGEFGKMLVTAYGEAGDTLGTFVTGKAVSIKRGCVHQTDVISTVITDEYCSKVTASRSDWSGEYLLVAEHEGKAYVMVTNTSFSDANCPNVIVEMGANGLPKDPSLSNCILKVTPHKADDSGTGPTRDQGGKYSILIQDGRGIGRYARTGFGFNNNERYGRFVNSISMNADKSMKITCTTKKDGESTLKFNLTDKSFGFALSSEKSSEGYLPVYFYELKN